MIVIYTDDTARVSLHVEPDGTDVPALVLRSIASLPASALSAENLRPTVRRRWGGPVTALVLAMAAAAGGYIAAPRGPTPVSTGAAYAASSSTELRPPQTPSVPPSLQHELEGRPIVTPPPAPAGGSHTQINPFGLQR